MNKFALVVGGRPAGWLAGWLAVGKAAALKWGPSSRLATGTSGARLKSAAGAE